MVYQITKNFTDTENYYFHRFSKHKSGFSTFSCIFLSKVCALLIREMAQSHVVDTLVYIVFCDQIWTKSWY